MYWTRDAGRHVPWLTFQYIKTEHRLSDMPMWQFYLPGIIKTYVDQDVADWSYEEAVCYARFLGQSNYLLLYLEFIP